MSFVAVGVGVAGAAISAGTSAASSAASSKANKEAAKIQAQKYAEAKAALEKAEAAAQGYIKPYATVGGSALDELAYGMGLTTPTEGYTSANTQKGGLANYGMDQYQQDVGYTPMVNSLADLQATPGYQFQLEQGLQGVNNSAAARGGLLSGANMKAINDYAQGQASTGYQNAWDRAQNAYTNAFSRNQQKFTNLQGMAVSGQNAAVNQGGYAINTGAALSNLATNNGNNMSNLALGQGQINASNISGIGNAIGGGVSRVGGLMGGKSSGGMGQANVNFGSNTGGGTGGGWPL